MNSRRILSIFLMTILFSSTGQVSSDLYLPSLPAISHALHASISLTQLSIALFMLGFCVGRLFFGPISDAIGRRKPLITSLVCCLVGSLICLFAQNIYILIAGRFLQGFGGAGGNILARIILRDMLEGTTLAKYNSYYSMANISLIAVAPLLGGYLQHFFGWRANFTFLSLYMFITILIAIFMLTETNKHIYSFRLYTSTIKNDLKILLSDTVFLSYVGIAFLAYGCLLAWLTSSSIVLQKVFRLTSVEFGWVCALVGFCYFSGAFINGKLVSKVGMRVLLRFGVICVGLAGLVMVVSTIFGLINTWFFVGPVMISFFGLSMIFPNVYAAGLTPFPKMAGIAAAIISFFQISGGFATSILMSSISEFDQLPVGVVFIMAVIIIFVFMRKLGKSDQY